MMNFCTFKNISVFRVFVKSVEPNNNKSVFKSILNPFIIILVLDWDKFYTLGYVCNAALSIITYFVETL
jgi:hypothetical protein